MSAKRRKKRAKNKAKRQALEAEIMAPFAAQYDMTWHEWKEAAKKEMADPKFKVSLERLAEMFKGFK